MNVTEINTQIDHLKSLAFPAWADDDALVDWQAELAEVDGYLVGLAYSALNGEKIDTQLAAQHIRRLRSTLETIDHVSAEDRTIRDQCVAYLIALEGLVHSLIS